jgi:hypothetical protein
MSTGSHCENQFENQVENQVRIREPPNSGLELYLDGKENRGVTSRDPLLRGFFVT